ncbi:hypothetical protein KCU95_g18237, partial [Aureobasidium melanogenum]
MEHERSPDGELGPDRKRRRKVLSCMDCRRRKVQCDRALPVCGRCEKAGKPCSYEDDSPPQHVSSTQGTSYVPRQQSVTVSKDVWDDMLNKLLHQERIIERLQTAHTSPTTPATVSIATPQLHGIVETPGGFSDSAAKERILFRGKGFKTTFFGPSDARSTMTLNAHNFFLEEASRNPELVSYEEVLALTQELELNLASLPDWTGGRLMDLTAHDQSIALLHIQLEQFLVILHAQAARQAVAKTHTNFSKQAFKSAAISIVDKLSELSNKGSKFLLMVRSDIQRVFTSTLALGNTDDKDVSSQDLRSLVQPFLELAEKALDLFEEKILSTGGIQWTHTFVVYDMLLCKISPIGRNILSRPGSDRLFSICKKIMAHQDADFSEKVAPLKESIPTPTKIKKRLEGKTNAPSEINSIQQTATTNNDLLTDFSYPDMLDWNFDDWMLYTDTFWSTQNMSLPSLSEQNLQ